MTSYLWAEAKRGHHEEEKDGPHDRYGHARDGFRVDDEGEARSSSSDLTHIHALLDRHEAQDREDDETRVDACGTVDEGDDDGVSARRHTMMIGP